MADQAKVSKSPERLTALKAGGASTVIVTTSKAVRLGEPSSRTRTITEFVSGAVTVAVDQVKMPVAGSNTAPSGPPGSRLKVRFCGGVSESLAVATNVRVWPRW